MTDPLEVLFRCIPLGTTLRRRACGARHLRAELDVRGGGKKGVPRMDCGTCATCVVGAAHARGETPSDWPDGEPLALRDLALAPTHPAPRSEERSEPASTSPPTEAPVRSAPRAAVPDPHEERDGGPVTRKRVLIEYRGESKTAWAWAQDPERVELGISAAMILARIKDGWEPHDALTTPKIVREKRAAVTRRLNALFSVGATTPAAEPAPEPPSAPCAPQTPAVEPARAPGGLRAALALPPPPVPYAIGLDSAGDDRRSMAVAILDEEIARRASELDHLRAARELLAVTRSPA